MQKPELDKFLEKIFLDRGISEVFHRQDFFIDLIKGDIDKDYPPNIRIQLYSDWRLNDKIWWNDMVIHSPLKTMEKPY